MHNHQIKEQISPTVILVTRHVVMHNYTFNILTNLNIE